MTNETAYEKILKKVKHSVDWDLHAICCFIMSQDLTMNKPSNRFDKSHVLSHHLENLSNGEILYVDEDGWDFETPQRMEDKTGATILKNKNGTMKAIIRVLLRNTMGNKIITAKQFRESMKFPCLLIRQTGGLLGEQYVAALDSSKLTDEDIVFTKDQVQLCFDSEKLDLVYCPDEEKIKELEKLYEEYMLNSMESYSEFKTTMQKMYVEEMQNKITNSRLRLESGENIEKTSNNDSSIQGEQKAAAW